MILRAYAIFDRKALMYNTPFFYSTDGQAIRALTDLVNDSNTTLSRHPADYVLYLIGSFDSDKGFIAGIDPLVHVKDAAQCVAPSAAVLPFDQQRKEA